MERVKVKGPLLPVPAAVLVWLCVASVNVTAFSANTLLHAVQNAAYHIASAVESSPRTALNHDTLAVYVYRDDYRFIKEYLDNNKERASSADPEEIMLKAISLQQKDSAVQLFMKFTDGRGDMLPQKISVRFPNGPKNYDASVNVQFVEENAVRPFSGIRSGGMAALRPAWGGQVEKTRVPPAGIAAAEKDHPKDTTLTAVPAMTPSVASSFMNTSDPMQSSMPVSQAASLQQNNSASFLAAGGGPSGTSQSAPSPSNVFATPTAPPENAPDILSCFANGISSSPPAGTTSLPDVSKSAQQTGSTGNQQLQFHPFSLPQKK